MVCLSNKILVPAEIKLLLTYKCCECVAVVVGAILFWLLVSYVHNVWFQFIHSLRFSTVYYLVLEITDVKSILNLQKKIIQ